MFFCVTSGFLAVERSGRRQHVFVVTVWLAEMVLSIATLCKNNCQAFLKMSQKIFNISPDYFGAFRYNGILSIMLQQYHPYDEAVFEQICGRPPVSMDDSWAEYIFSSVWERAALHPVP